jgi:hypothetical protein
LEDELARKASLEQRALAIISTSGGLITLILALSALLLGKDPSATLGHAPRTLLVMAVSVLVTAAILGLVANAPNRFYLFSAGDIDRMIGEWEFNQEEAEILVAEMQARIVKNVAKSNNRKGRVVQFGVAFAVLGVTFVASAVVVALFK